MRFGTLLKGNIKKYEIYCVGEAAERRGTIQNYFNRRPNRKSNQPVDHSRRRNKKIKINENSIP